MLATTNFWQQTKSPLMMLAPMEDVTDTAFREVVMRLSSPGFLNVTFTEFTSVEGFAHPVGREKVAHRLIVSSDERELLQKMGVKIVAQIWGTTPEHFAHAAREISEHYQFDGIDINMGCPVKNVVANGAGSALIDSPQLAAEIIAATRASTHLPLSVKTRLGVRKVETRRWISFLLQQPIDALIVHGRIQRQMSTGVADWTEIALAVALRNELASHVKLIGNGDVMSVQDAQYKMDMSGADGVMVGRGIFNNPWLFDNREGSDISHQERINALKLHLSVFERNWGSQKNYAILKRFFKIYVAGFHGASDLRQQLMETNNYSMAHQIIRQFEHTVGGIDAEAIVLSQ